MSNFPKNVDTFLRAKDPETISDINIIRQYQQYLSNGYFSLAAAIFAGSQMSLNASRFNQVLDAVTAIEKFYLGNEGVQNYINNQIKAYSNIEQWGATTNYNVGNLVAYNGRWYKCLRANKGVKPDSSIGVYWELFIEPQQPKQYPVSAEQPEGQSLKDLWFRVID